MANLNARNEAPPQVLGLVQPSSGIHNENAYNVLGRS